MADTVNYLAKIKLSDGSEYVIDDINALKSSGGTITGDLTVDNKIKTDKLYIMSIEYMVDTPTNVLVQNESTGLVEKRDINKLLGDIGGISYSISDDGNLTLKYGKQ